MSFKHASKLLAVTLSLFVGVSCTTANKNRRFDEVPSLPQNLSYEYDGPWRKTLNVCWTESGCERALTVAHGGAWNLTYPYDSLPAFNKAWEIGSDAVKGDFRVSKDNIGMVMHSSPIEIYESFNCFGKRVEEMTAKECQDCIMLNTDYHFISVPDFLAWGRGKSNVMLCVKEDIDIPRAISTLIEEKATDRAFLEIHINALLNVSSTGVTGWSEVYYVVNVDSMNNFNLFATAPQEVIDRGFLVEINDWDDKDKWSEEDLSYCLQKIKELGKKSFAATRSGFVGATVSDHLRIYHTGFDVVYTYNTENAVEARRYVNIHNRVFPP